MAVGFPNCGLGRPRPHGCQVREQVLNSGFLTTRPISVPHQATCLPPSLLHLQGTQIRDFFRDPWLMGRKRQQSFYVGSGRVGLNLPEYLLGPRGRSASWHLIKRNIYQIQSPREKQKVNACSACFVLKGEE